MSPRDKFEVKSAADKSGVSLTDNGMSNFYLDYNWETITINDNEYNIYYK